MIADENLKNLKNLNHPIISIIVNCYNSEKFLRETLQSAQAQSFENWELIFWDNQSTDGSATIFKSFLDERMRFFLSPKHTTLSEARNLAVEKARGKWIAFLDCDDIWHADKLSSQVKIIESESNDLGVVYGRTHFLSAEGEKGREVFERFVGKPLPEGYILERLLLEGDFIPLVSALFLKEAYLEMGGIPTQYVYAEDYYLLVAIAERYRTRAVQTSCCYYRVHEGNLTKKMKEELYIEPLAIIDKWQTHLTLKKYQQKRSEYLTLLALQRFKAGKALFPSLKQLFLGSSFSFLLYRMMIKIGKTVVISFRKFREKYA